jgi:hypothetical protein
LAILALAVPFLFLGLIFYWHEKKTTLVVVPLLYTFEFFIAAFLGISAVSLLLQYSPEILDAIKILSNS